MAVAAATGRDIAQISPAVMDCFAYAVAANGAYLLDNGSGRLIAAHPMEPRLAAHVVREILRHGGGPSLFHGGRMAAALRSPLLMPGGSPGAYFKAKRAYCPHLGLSPLLGLRAGHGADPVYKIQGFFPNPERSAAAAASLKRRSELAVLDMGDGTVEVTMAGVTKAAGLGRLCAELGISAAELAAFGDSRNDLEMLQMAGYAVAMANGADCVKAAADYIAGDVAEDGAAGAIYDLFR